MTLDLTNFLNQWAIPTFAVVLGACIWWLTKKTGSWLDAHAQFLNATTKQRLLVIEQQALTQGAQAIVNWAQSQEGKVHPHIKDPLVGWGAQVALNHANGVLRDNGYTPEKVAAMILANLPPTTVSNDPAKCVSSTPADPVKPQAKTILADPNNHSGYIVQITHPDGKPVTGIINKTQL